MCLPAIGAAVAGMTGAATAGAALAQVGTVVGMGASVLQGVNAYRTGQANARMLRAQAATEGRLSAVQDQRERRGFLRQIRQQAAELIGRGVSLDSPTAIMLGEEAGREMSFHSQAIRSGADARRQEMGWSARMQEAQGRQALLTGTLSAAGRFLTAAPDVWPSLLSGE